MQLGESDLTTFPESVDGVQAVEALQAHWPQGTLLTLEVVVTNAQDGPTKAAIAAPRAQAAGHRRSERAGPAGHSPRRLGGLGLGRDGGLDEQRRELGDRPARSAARWCRRSSAACPASHVYVTGDAAESLDNTKIYTDGMVRVFLFVLTLSFLLLMVVFHSIVIPTKAILLNLLSTGAAYGARRPRLPGRLVRLTPGRPADRRDPELDPDLHLHGPVRAVDGLRGVHPVPDQGVRGPRR